MAGVDVWKSPCEVRAWVFGRKEVNEVVMGVDDALLVCGDEVAAWGAVRGKASLGGGISEAHLLLSGQRSGERSWLSLHALPFSHLHLMAICRDSFNSFWSCC